MSAIFIWVGRKQAITPLSLFVLGELILQWLFLSILAEFVDAMVQVTLAVLVLYAF